MNKRMVIAGGSGFLGKAIEAHFVQQGWQVQVLTRNPRRPNDVAWDGRTQGDWAKVLNGADAVINLSGKSIAVVHTPEVKQEVVKSRVDSIHALRDAILACATPPAVWVQSGGIDAVGEHAQAQGEIAPVGGKFLPEVCKIWEQTFAEAKAVLPATRGVQLRIGPVLGKGGGMLGPLVTITKLFVGGTVGSGKQHMSWIHLQDVVGIIDWAIQTPSASGIYNAVAPDPRDNASFMATLRKVIGRPWAPPAPSFAMRIVAPLIGTDPSLLLDGSHGKPARLLAEGYSFAHPTLEGALTSLI